MATDKKPEVPVTYIELLLKVKQLETLIRAIVFHAPRVSCEDFHHCEEDQHTGRICSPLERWNELMRLADKLTKPKKDGAH